jgi:hypothetical protein
MIIMNPKTDMTFGKTNASLFRKKGNKRNGAKQRILDIKKPPKLGGFLMLDFLY